MAGAPVHENTYVFNRHYRSSVRLNLNHWLIQQQLGYLLHPKIPTNVSDLHVADIGTGTGIWLIDLSHHLSTSNTLNGFDVSPAQFPPPAWLPQNVRLYAHDVFTPFAEEHRGRYDVVHMRFMTTVLRKENMHTILENLASLLKPGGHLQWLDLEPLSVRISTLDPTGPLEETAKVAALMRRSGASPMHDLSSSGLHSVAMDRFRIADCYRMPWGQSHLMGYEELWTRQSEAKGNSADVLREGLEAVERLNNELKAGASLDCEYFCWVVRKP